ncbi:hypothetical protein IE81DRAFT_332854 [Ceraceosorus guamensis]|uniref:Uncharacterized protein n=1 Tax=Ceraceosorus guamensis TaxID=1522189 RepID=A0A316VMC7_9BASI|nr:hypothetical protein IE81DRAFT_332854 [Ceraceosorus guamensis]PWN38697.1 hypothetical protein IE81DRAFT_332854 [Ceraceosorus guamensis]
MDACTLIACHLTLDLQPRPLQAQRPLHQCAMVLHLEQERWDALVPAEKVYHKAKALKAAIRLKHNVDELINHLAQDTSMVIGSEAAYLLVAAESEHDAAQSQLQQLNKGNKDPQAPVHNAQRFKLFDALDASHNALQGFEVRDGSNETGSKADGAFEIDKQFAS